MTASRHPQINQELLSAYLDNEVTAEERAQIEIAIAGDPTVAWQVETLRQTVRLVQTLPPLALPRSFTLETIVAETKPDKVLASAKPATAHSARTVSSATDAAPQWWQWLSQIWQGGNLQLRNAATVAFALLIVLFASNQFVTPYEARLQQQRSAGQQAANSTENTLAYAPTRASETAAAATPTLASTNTPPATQQATSTPLVVVANANEAPSDKGTPVAQPTAMADGATMKQLVPMNAPGEDTEDLSGGSSAPSFTQAPAPETLASASVADASADASRSAAAADSIQAETEVFSVSTSVVVTATNEVTVSAPSPAAQSTITEVVTEAVTATNGVTTTAAIMQSDRQLTVSPTSTTVGLLESSRGAAAESTEYTDNVTAETARWLSWAQVITALCTVVLGVLWWRSRG